MKMFAVIALILMAGAALAWTAGDPAGPPASNGSGYATSHGGTIIIGIDNSITIRFDPTRDPLLGDVHFPAWELREGPWDGEFAFSSTDEPPPHNEGYYTISIYSNNPAPPKYGYSVVYVNADGNWHYVEQGTFNTP